MVSMGLMLMSVNQCTSEGGADMRSFGKLEQDRVVRAFIGSRDVVALPTDCRKSLYFMHVYYQ